MSGGGGISSTGDLLGLRCVLGGHGFPATGLEGEAVHYLEDEGLERVTLGFEFAADFVDCGAVIGLEAAADRVGEHLLDDAMGKIGELADEDGAHFGGRVEG